MTKMKVLVIGGGFGGLNVVRSLKKADVDILLLDQTNHHLFQPLLYQVATAALSITNIASPIREIVRNQKNVEVLMEKVIYIDKVKKNVITEDGKTFFFDYLVIATGACHSYFGHEEWEKFAPGLKTSADGERICRQILLAFEKAECCENPQEAQNYLRFAIIGAGPTGVEMAGSIAEFVHRTLFKNFRRINPTHSKIYLIEGTGQVLPNFSPELGEKAQKNLESLGVEVLLNTFVTHIFGDGVYIGDQFLAAPTVIWAAGNQASSLLKTLHISLDKQGRAIVNADLTIPAYPNIFVIGDAAYCLNATKEPLPAIAPVAIQQGRYVANIIKQPQAEKRQPFIYFDKGTVATIGGGKAVVMIGQLQLSGLFAWLIWCFVHIFYLVSFRYRILVMMQWIFLYLLGRRQARVIVQPTHDECFNEK